MLKSAHRNQPHFRLVTVKANALRYLSDEARQTLGLPIYLLA